MDLSEMARAFLSQALDQDHRAVRLAFGGKHGAVLDRALMPQVAHIREAACEGLTARIVCVSTRADLQLEQLKGLPLETQLVTDTGELRRACGIVTAVRELESDGGAAMIELTVRDAFGVMEGGRTSRVFLNKSVLDIARILLGGWRAQSSTLAWAFDYRLLRLNTERYPARAFTFQFNESDSQFLRRLFAREGIAWFFRALEDAPGPAHELVLFDDTAALPQNAAGPVRFHRRDGTERRDTINLLSMACELVAGRVARNSYDHERSRVDSNSVVTRIDQGDAGNDLAALLRDVRIDIPHAGDSSDDRVRLTRLDIERHEYRAQRWHGVGGVRAMAVCEWNAIGAHPRLDTLPAPERELVCIELEHWAQNNLPKEMNARLLKLLGDAGQAPAWARHDDAHTGCEQRYSNRFVAVARSTRITPVRNEADLPRPPLLTAEVVGPPGEPVHCDELGRVKVRFLGLQVGDHAHANGAGTTGTAADSAWVRVDSLWAGEGYGVIFPLRAGMEVDIGFAGGDLDRPVITGSRYHWRNPPPRFDHLGGLPHNRALSGVVTRELQGSRQQQLRFDDTRDAINVQLACDHAHSQLSLGFLRTPMDQGKASARGEGVELRTLAAAVVRAAQGVLLLTEGHTSPDARQLQRDELKASLAGALALMQRLDGAATMAQAHASDLQPMSQLGDSVARLEAGTNVASGQAGGQQPVIGIAAGAGVAVTTPRSATIATGENLDLAVNGNLQQAVHRQWTLNSGGSISWFAAGQTLPQPPSYTMSMIAGAGNLLAQAQKGAIRVEADREIRIGSNTTVRIDAEGGVLITEHGGAQIELKGGNITQRCTGTYTVHAAAFDFAGPAGGAAQLPSMPGAVRMRDWLALRYLDPDTAEPIAQAPSEVRYASAAVLSADLDAQGQARHATVPGSRIEAVTYQPRPPKEEDRCAPLEALR